MLDQKVALITGASRGIGSAIAQKASLMGFFTVVHYKNRKAEAENTLKEICKGGGSGMLARANLSKLDEIQNLVSMLKNETGRMDVLVNNAGMAPIERKDLLEMTEISFDEVLATNLKGPFFLTQAIAAWMIDLRAQVNDYTPYIINIGSISAYTSSVNRGEYCISKAGLGMVTRLFADRLAQEGILVYEIRPGVVKTDMTAAVEAKYDSLIRDGMTPIRRWGQPEDVAKAVEAIVKGLLPFSTGEVINVDGGFHLRRL